MPDASVARLSDYLRVLDLLGAEVHTVSSGELAAAAGVGPAQLRKDLSYLGGAHGVRGVGYDVPELARRIRGVLRAGRRPVVVVGAGRLGRAVAEHSSLVEAGFFVVAVVDRDPDVIGRSAGGIVISHVDGLPDVVREHGPVIGIVTTSTGGAQQAVDDLAAAGVTSVLTFAPGALTVPSEVRLRRLDVANELQILAFHAENDAPAPPRDPAVLQGWEENVS